MFSRILTKKSTPNFSDKLEQLKKVLDEADAVFIGAGAGLSTAAGFTYSGQRFEQYFGDFKTKYGITDMYSGGFYPFATQEELWAWWSRHIWYNRYVDAPIPVYDQLLELVQGKDYFVLTTNVDHCFQKAGFDKKRLFYTQGDYGLFQCSEPCCQETWDNEDAVKAMLEQQKDMRIPSELIPRCPHCGQFITMNLRSDDKFVEDQGWNAAAHRYQDFVRRHQRGKVVYLEIGVGYNTPSIIKFNFWRQVYSNPDAVYVCLNYADADAPKEIENRSICISGDSAKVIALLCQPKTQTEVWRTVPVTDSPNGADDAKA